jgi:hypothetical protein
MRKAIIVSEAVRRARWVEAETIRLKRMGFFSFEEIAEHITSVGRGQAQPMVATSDISFPADYQISRQACHGAFKKALAREPALEVEELRKLDSQRCEEMYLNLQPAIRKGDPPAVAVGVKVLSHKAKINGYAAPQKHELTGKHGNGMTVSRNPDAVELESKVNLLRDAIQVLRDLEVPGVIDLPEQDFTALPAGPSERVEEPRPSCTINLP